MHITQWRGRERHVETHIWSALHAMFTHLDAVCHRQPIAVALRARRRSQLLRQGGGDLNSSEDPQPQARMTAGGLLVVPTPALIGSAG
jgi:hypothetical protein